MKLISIILVCTLFACSTKQPKYIQGYVYNEYRKPIEGIKLEDPSNKKLYAITNDKGYFKINEMINGRYLYLSIEKEKIDSVYIVRTHPERGVSYSFIGSRNDTVFIDMKKQKIISQ